MVKSFYRPCWADINLGALRHNLKNGPEPIVFEDPAAGGGQGERVRTWHGPRGTSRSPTRSILPGVSSLEEGEILREAGVTAPVLVARSALSLRQFFRSL